jgi:hypothetical protein
MTQSDCEMCCLTASIDFLQMRNRLRRHCCPLPSSRNQVRCSTLMCAPNLWRSVDATMATMTDAPYVTHVPVMTGGYGYDEVRQFYATWFIGRWPADVQITPISRTVGQGRVIDELIVSFTHDMEMPALMPGIAPTSRKVTLPHVVVMGIVLRRSASLIRRSCPWWAPNRQTSSAIRRCRRTN